MSSNTAPSFVNIDDHGLLLVRGPDASKFLQGQVTCDIAALSNNEVLKPSCLGAHCSHKGRMLFSFRACQLDSQTIALSIFKDLIPEALATLKKYSVFSKVELIDAYQDYRIIGFSGDDLSKLNALIPALPEKDNDAYIVEGMAIIKIGTRYYECWIPYSKLTEIPQTTKDADYWSAINIAQGIGEIRPETVAEFIPQMLNYQSIGKGISFKKGCYTGQEVVARMQYLGKLKRRMYRFKTNYVDSIKPGEPLFSPRSTSAVGQTVISARTNNHRELLAVVKEDVINNNEIYLDENYQYKLEALPLPYAINKE